MSKYIPAMTDRQHHLLTQLADYAKELKDYEGKSLAYVCDDNIYIEGNDDRRSKWKSIVDDPELKDIEILDSHYEPVYITINSVPVKVGDRKFMTIKDANGNICVVFYGTDDAQDIYDDYRSQVAGNLPLIGSQDLDSANKYMDSIIKKYGSENIYVAGHSHGGYIAAEVLKSHQEFIKRAFLYNAQLRGDDYPWNKIDAVRVKGELLSEYLYWLGICSNNETWTSGGNPSRDAWGKHGYNGDNYGDDGYIGVESIKFDTDVLYGWKNKLEKYKTDTLDSFKPFLSPVCGLCNKKIELKPFMENFNQYIVDRLSDCIDILNCVLIEYQNAETDISKYL